MFQSKLRSSLFSLLLFSALAISSPFASAEEVPNSSNAIERLRQISTRLEVLNGRLQAELRDCQTNLNGLKFQLASSSLEMANLSRQLADSKAQIELLSNANRTSREELAALLILQRKAENSLMNLEASLEAYRRKAEAEIKKWKGLVVVGVVAGVLVGGGVGYLLRGASK